MLTPTLSLPRWKRSARAFRWLERAVEESPTPGYLFKEALASETWENHPKIADLLMKLVKRARYPIEKVLAERGLGHYFIDDVTVAPFWEYLARNGNRKTGAFIARHVLTNHQWRDTPQGAQILRILKQRQMITPKVAESLRIDESARCERALKQILP